MKLIISILAFIVIGYYSYRFIQVLVKMRQNPILPTTDEERKALRKIPQKIVDFPTYSKQKVGIIVYASMLLFILVMFIIGMFLEGLKWPFYLMLLLPLSYSRDLLNLFAVMDDGLLCGIRFVAWGKIKSFQFVPIGINHKYYGHAKEVNDGYELKVKAKGYSISGIVTSHEMKERLTKMLRVHGLEEEESQPLREPK